MDDKNLSQIVLKKIAEQHIIPKSKWKFLMKDYVIWSFSALFIAVGGFAVAVMIHMSRTNDWELFSNSDGSFIEFALASVPYFWLVLFLLFVLMAQYNLKHTRSGYRYRVKVIVVFSVFGSVFLGSVFYVAGLGQSIDKIFEENIDFYGRYMSPYHRAWTRPHYGTLSGRVNEIIPPDQINIIDINGDTWVILTRDTLFIEEVPLGIGSVIGSVGHQVDEYVFEAEVIKVRPEYLPFGRPKPPKPQQYQKPNQRQPSPAPVYDDIIIEL